MSKKAEKKKGSFLSEHKTKLIALAVLMLATYITFLPALENEFTNWDDPKYIIDNHIIKDLSWERTRAIFMDEERKSGLYAPLTYLSWAVEFSYVNLEPYVYHRDNIVLHLLNTALVFLLIMMLVGRIEAALITAALFGLHPMHVESVAWITERKDVLFTFFFLLSLISYTAYAFQEKNKKRNYIVAVLMMLLSLLSKPAAVVLPIMLLLIDYLKFRLLAEDGEDPEKTGLVARLMKDKRILIEKLPFFGLSLIWGYITVNTTRSIAEGETFSLMERTLFAFYGLTNYLYKLILPIDLSCFYPYPRLIDGHLPIIYYIAPAIVISLAYLIYRTVKFTRDIVFGSLFFFFSIALVLQFFPVGPNIVTDRYTYVPYIGLFFIIGQAYLYVADSANKKIASFKNIMLIGLAGIMGACGYLSHERCKVWKNSETLWTDVIAKFPNTSEGYLNRGQYYTDSDQFDKALLDYEVTLQLNPKSTLAYINRGNVYGRRGVFDEALFNYGKAIELTPGASKIYLNRGNVYGMKGLIDSSIVDYTRAIALERNYLDAYINRAISYSKLRDFDNAFKDFNLALQINPRSFKTYAMRAYAYLDRGMYEACIADYNLLIQHDPNDVNSYFYRALAKQRNHDFAGAIVDYSVAIKLNPANASAYMNRGISYEALKQYKQALRDALSAQQGGQQVGAQYLQKLQALAAGP
ncbi:MAG TPA: tetratricopeptide repeat protein [Flavobacteriales bacterium]|nr:tetratricopeptide repeat protein [Flavobacteriales bacterium]